MKKYKIKTYLRPAILSDVFDKNGHGNILEEKQFFYKENDGFIYGPYRNYEPCVFICEEYLNLNNLIYLSKIFIVDAIQYAKSIAIQLCIKQVEEDDILQNGFLIVNTAYFIVRLGKAEGPFYITKTTTKSAIRNFIAQQQFFVFDRPGIIKEI